jgi:hypothetical protein
MHGHFEKLSADLGGGKRRKAHAGGVEKGLSRTAGDWLRMLSIFHL